MRVSERRVGGTPERHGLRASGREPERHALPHRCVARPRDVIAAILQAISGAIALAEASAFAADR